MERQDLIEKIKSALESQKVDPYIADQFEALLRKQPNMDLSQVYVSCLAKGIRKDIKVEGIDCRLRTIYIIRIPYSRIHELVENADLVGFEASR